MFQFKTLAGALTKLKSALPPLKEVLSENGVGSYSRYSGFMIVIATIAWVTYLVIHNHAFPDMAGPTAFIAGGQTQYAVGQVKNIAAAAKSGVTGNTVPVAQVSDAPTIAITGGNNDVAQS